MGAYARMEHHREPTLTLLINSIRGGLTGARDRVAARGARRISTEVFIGEPAAEILAGQADLIVMGGRGHGRLTGLLLGGVAQKVVALAAMSGAAAAVTALTPVASSGSDVTVASRMMPIQLPERPVLSAIMSPLRDSFGPANPTNARHRPNANQICVADIP